MKKVFNVLKSIFVYTVLAISVGMMLFTLISVNTFNKTDKSIFGYKFFVVLSDSMSATHFDAGDVIVSKEVDITTLKEEDVITFISQNPSNQGEIVTHCIRSVTVDDNGATAFVTYGTTTNTNDEALATMVLGQYQFRIPKVGYFFNFLKTTPGYIVCILVPFLILMLSQGINCIRLFRRYRAEQLEDLQAERAEIENEREESRKMMEELLALKEQLAKAEAASGAQAAMPKENADGNVTAESEKPADVEIPSTEDDKTE